MRLVGLKTASEIAAEHGQGIIVVVNGHAHALVRLTVVDHSRDLALCHGHDAEGNLIVFDAEQVDTVRIPPGPDGKRAKVREIRSDRSGTGPSG